MMELTVSQENYLKTILLLSREGRGTRITDIADKLQIQKASVSHAVYLLEDAGYLQRNVKREAVLTEKGQTAALQIIERYETVKRFFCDILSLNDSVSALDACQIEHCISPESLLAMQRLLMPVK